MRASIKRLLALAGGLVLAFALQAEAPPPASPAAETRAATPDEAGSPDEIASPEEPRPSEEEAEATEVYSEEIEVRGRASDLVGIATSATEGITGWVELQKRPILRPGELVETTPGVIATQHSGGGKANQYFLRGFNLDHGTDFSVWVGGVPVNMPSHGHGQGYADLNFLIPEIVSSVHFRKGPYDAQHGDFSAAGGTDIELVDALPEQLVSLTGGSYEYGRLLLADSFEVGSGTLTAAVDVFQENGPWAREEDYDGYKAFARYAHGDASRGFALTFMGYDADWLSTDQIPRRAVEAGLIDRFDLIDPGPRGATQRFSLAAETHRGRAGSLTRANAYLLRYDFDLVSSFTYFLEDPVNGDQFEQVDERWVGGVAIRHTWESTWGRRAVETTVGFEARYDDIDNGLFRTRDRVRIGTTRQDAIQQLGAGPFVSTEIHWRDRVRTVLGLRADYLGVDVTSDRAVNNGREDDVLVSPKFTLVLGPWRQTELYLNLGTGFHSNDARGATLRIDPASGEPAAPVDLLVRAEGADLGLRTTAIPGLQTTVSFFLLELDSELLFVGDGGATEASRPSRRQGVEWTNFYRLNDHLTFDLDLTYTDATFTDDDPAGDEIPGAIERTVAAGISFEGWAGLYGSLRLRYFSHIPLIEDGSVVWDDSSLVNARLGYRFRNGLDLGLEIFNLLDADDSDIEYFYASRLPGEPTDGVEDVHFHPMPERSARLVATWRY